MFSRRFPCGLTVWLVLAKLAATAAGTTKGSVNLESRYHVIQRTTEDGLPHNWVSALAQTPDGYLWVGTWDGLARFDGIRFKVFHQAELPAMSSEEIHALAVDQEGVLWLGTSDGLLRMRERRSTRFSQADGLPSAKVWRLIASREGGVWMHCGSYAVRWRDSRPEFAVPVLFAPGQEVRSLQEESDGSLRVVTSVGIQRISPSGERQVLALPALPGAVGASLGGAWQNQDGLWTSLQEGLWRLRDGVWKQVLSDVARADLGTFVQGDRDGGLWVNRRAAGFWHCRGESVEPMKLGERGAEKTVGCLLEDAEGHIWFGTSHGLFQARPKTFQTLTVEHGLPDGNCQSVHEAPDGAVWVETVGGVGRIQGGEAQTFPEEASRHRGHSILVDHEASVWLGNRHSGLIQWRPGVATNRFWDAGHDVTVEALYRARDGRIWVGTDRGATWFENGTPTAWGQFGLTTTSTRSIYQTRDGAMWFGTWQQGAVRWRAGRSTGSPPDSVTRYTTADGLADDRVFVFHEDVEGTLWIGTHGGLSRLKGGKLFTFRREHGLFNNLIHWLEEDDFGRLWLSCNQGVFRMDRAELNEVAEGRRARARAIAYGTADGMVSAETNGEHQPAGCKTRDGRIWFPTTDGVVVIDPRQTGHTEVAPKAVIESVRADGQLVWGDGWEEPARKAAGETGERERADPAFAFRLSPGRARELQIRYTANSFLDPRRNRFQYRMTNHDPGWREETTERLAVYTNLRPGSFRFEVRAANAHDVWSETPTVLAFSLAPHFWQTWPFYVCCALGALGLVTAFTTYRLRWQRRWLTARHQQALAEERARIARDLHDDLGTALTGVALEIDVARRQSGDKIAVRLGESAAHVRAMAERMREVVWAVNPRCDTVPSLASFLEQQAGSLLRTAGVRGRFEFPEDIPPLPLDSETRHQLALGVREALANVLRHAQALEVVLSLSFSSQELIVTVRDDGRGFEAARTGPEPGHGLHNLGTRLKRLGGTMAVVSKAGSGTRVEFRVPLKPPTKPKGTA